MSSNLFTSIFTKGFDSATTTVSNIPYLADQQIIGRGAKWLTNGACRLVGNYTPSKYKNAEFSGFFRKFVLATTGLFGAPEIKNIAMLRSRVWLTKPLEFLRASCIGTARQVYDSCAQNFHAEMEVPRVVDQICQAAMSQCARKNDPTHPGTVLKDGIRPIIAEKVLENPFTMAQACASVSRVALPEALEQGMRIFLITGLWSYLTDSPFLSTFATVTTLTTSVSLLGNRSKLAQGSIYAAEAASILYLSSNSQWLSTILSVGHLAIWWGFIANGKTAELATYRPPESGNRVADLVTKEKGAILDKVAEVLEPDGGMKELEATLGQIKFQHYPFSAFVDQRAASSSGGKRVRIAEKHETVPERLSYQDAEDARKKYISTHDGRHEEHADYWGLVLTEYIEKAKYYGGRKEWNKYVTCVRELERARFKQLGLLDDDEKFKRMRLQTIEMLGRKLEQKELRRNGRLTSLLKEVHSYKHPNDV